VRKYSVDELVKRIQDRSVITRDSVLRESKYQHVRLLWRVLIESSEEKRK
jgi:hypothetical protein